MKLQPLIAVCFAPILTLTSPDARGDDTDMNSKGEENLYGYDPALKGTVGGRYGMDEAQRILVVDDEPGPREALRIILDPQYQVVTATDGPEALRVIHDTPPDLVFLDVRMPGMDGLEVLKAVKDVDSRIEAIIMTGYASLETVRGALAYGASEYLIKPFSEDEVDEAVKKALARRAERMGEHQQIQTLLEDLRGLAVQNSLLRERLAHSEKLSALGEMAAGIAHNLNNILAAIMGRAQLLVHGPADAETLQRGVATIQRAVEDGATMVQRIQRFARGGLASEFRATDLNQLVQETVEATQLIWKDQPLQEGGTIEVVMELGALPPVRSRPAELREVLINLILNAVDAMPAGGTLTVRTLVRGGVACIEIADTGIGMTEEVKRRAFTPFFTTKGAKGTGLGLSISHALIRDQHGEIELQSEPGKGTTFVITLPLQ